MAGRRRSGWFRLRSGRPFYGTIPDGAEEIPAPAVAVPERPAESAPKQAWVDHARQVGVDPDGLTKADLIAAVTSTGEELVDAGDRGGDIGSVALGDEQVAEQEQVPDRPRSRRRHKD